MNTRSKFLVAALALSTSLAAPPALADDISSVGVPSDR